MTPYAIQFQYPIPRSIPCLLCGESCTISMCAQCNEMKHILVYECFRNHPKFYINVSACDKEKIWATYFIELHYMGARLIFYVYNGCTILQHVEAGIWMEIASFPDYAMLDMPLEKILRKMKTYLVFM